MENQELKLRLLSIANGDIDKAQKAYSFVTEEHKENTCVDSATAYAQLIALADKWNEEDDFHPAHSPIDQDKYYPNFKYYTNVNEFIFQGVCRETCGFDAHPCFGLHLFFKSEQRAEDFALKYQSLWNKFLLN